MSRSDYTEERLFKGSVVFRQSKNGYRYTVDPLILAAFADPNPGESVADLGTGNGIIPLLIGHRVGRLRIVGIEIQPALAGLASENLRRNLPEADISVVQADMKAYAKTAAAGTFDLVISNPPYTAKGKGRVNPASEKAIARHEIHITLNSLILTACRLLKTGGRFSIIYPAKRQGEVLSELRRNRLCPVFVRQVFTMGGKEPFRVLVSAVKDACGETVIMEPLVIYDAPGVYSREMQKIFGDNGDCYLCER